MNFKTIFKGLGIGLITASVILIIGSKFNIKMSDEDVIKRAKELGLVENTTLTEPLGNSGMNELAVKDSDNNASNSDSDKENNIINNDSSENNDNGLNDNSEINDNQDVNDENKPDANNQDNQSDNKPDENNQLKEPDNDNNSNSDNDANDKEQNNPGNNDNNQENKPVVVNTGKTVRVEIRSGMSSESAAEAVKDAGLVKSDEDFNSFLCENGYDKRLRVGVYDIPEGSDFETIAKYLCGIE